MGADCRILYCHCAYARVIPPAVKAEVLARLTSADVTFEAVPDLCEMSARRDPRLRDLAQSGATEDGQPLVIAACYPRAVRWLFAAAEAPLPEQGVTVLNMRTESADTIVQTLLEEQGGAA